MEYGMTARSFTSFLQASEEAAVSRMYGGIHFKPAFENGMVQGRAIGSFIQNKIRTRKTEVASN